MIACGYGCPRSGTTFLQKALVSMEPSVLTVKIPEGSRMHPQQSQHGLIDLSRLFANKRMVVVRIVRHPVEVAASFLAARVFNEQRGGEWHGIARNTDDDILAMIRAEHVNTAVQRPHFEGDRGHRFVELRYESLGDPTYKSEVAGRICEPLGVAPTPFIDALAAFGRSPVRSGRLSEGRDPVPAERKEWFRSRLSDIIKREGYA